MAIQIGAKPDSGFDDPIGMLVNCHRRIERFLHVLCVVADRAHDRPLTDQESESVQSTLRYFRSGGQRHTCDEEESLFPRLRAEFDSGSFKELTALESDHRNANELHLAVDSLYSAWIASGRLSSDEEQRLVSATIQLKQLYEAHIQIEERIVFPRAAEMLTAGPSRPSVRNSAPDENSLAP